MITAVSLLLLSLSLTTAWLVISRRHIYPILSEVGMVAMSFGLLLCANDLEAASRLGTMHALIVVLGALVALAFCRTPIWRHRRSDPPGINVSTMRNRGHR